ncbi:hypothetical protein DIE12_05145 [Burkholderia sp. Bp9015]|nr:hypothetical protein WS52_24545 [Burkholderia territorii]KUZ46987.1 hypothetical protein WS53_01030 [Burkholderia territorii]RQR45568.1 hypothetical protein DIE20_04810 [Burkholderia sp. Bp9131]RQR77655.1 hypothetical protein DIE12_05145 [Burkholderia sp. Bp9015]
MKDRNGDQRDNVIDFATYRIARQQRLRIDPDESEFVTEIHFSITRGGDIVTSPPRFADNHLLAVLSWCQNLSALVLDSYLDATA